MGVLRTNKPDGQIRAPRGPKKKLREANSTPDTNAFPAGPPACTLADVTQYPETTWSVRPPPMLGVVLPAATESLEPGTLDRWLDPIYRDSAPNFGVKGGEAEVLRKEEARLDLGSFPN